MHFKDSHLIHYFILLIGFGVFLTLFLLFRYNAVVKNVLIISVCFFYSIWGAVHHHMENRLTKMILFEYIAISIFACILLLTGANL